MLLSRATSGPPLLALFLTGSPAAATDCWKRVRRWLSGGGLGLVISSAPQDHLQVIRVRGMVQEDRRQLLV